LATRRHRRARRSPRASDRFDSFIIIAVIFGLWFYLGMPGSEPEPPVLGNAAVRDADTLVIGEETFRLLGVDALEYHQTCIRDGETAPWPCGREAARALTNYIRGRTVSCAGEGRDRYGRTLARSNVGGVDLGEWLAENGWAFDSGRFGLGRYTALEREAANAKRGAWSGRFDKPWDWRPDHPTPRGFINDAMSDGKPASTFPDIA
jgi:endonuclease YncB( thermonuclease family)